MLHRTGKDKIKETEIRTEEKRKHETLTGVCFQWRDCGS